MASSLRAAAPSTKSSAKGFAHAFRMRPRRAPGKLLAADFVELDIYEHQHARFFRQIDQRR
jgi:hypothetical protein